MIRQPGVRGGSLLLVAAIGALVAAGFKGYRATDQPPPDFEREWAATLERVSRSPDDELLSIALDSGRPSVRRNRAIRELFCRRVPGALETVLRILYVEPAYPGRMALVELLGESEHPAALAMLLRVLSRDPDAGVRHAAVRAIDHNAVPDSLGALEALLDASQADRSSVVRRAAIRALARRAGDSIRAALERAGTSDSDPLNRHLALAARQGAETRVTKD